MRSSGVLASIVGLLCVSVIATASPVPVKEYSPAPANMDGLDHYWAYEWGIDVTLPPGESIIGAELVFDNIRNWDSSTNVLYVHQLDYCDAGLAKYRDNQGGGDYFTQPPSRASAHLETYNDLPATGQDITYTFTADDLV